MNKELLQQARDALQCAATDMSPIYWTLAALDAEIAKPEPVDREEEIPDVLGLAHRYATTYANRHLEVADEWLRLEAAVRALGVPKGLQ